MIKFNTQCAKKNPKLTKTKACQNKEAANFTKGKEPHAGKRSYPFAIGLTVRLTKRWGALPLLVTSSVKNVAHSNFCKRFKRSTSIFLSDRVSNSLSCMRADVSHRAHTSKDVALASTSVDLTTNTTIQMCLCTYNGFLESNFSQTQFRSQLQYGVHFLYFMSFSAPRPPNLNSPDAT